MQPVLTGINDDTLVDLVNDVSREFEGIKVIMARANDTTLDFLKKHATLQSLFDPNRSKWNSPKLLDWFYDKLKPNKDRIILTS